jgi:hypothetical protein
MSIDLVERLRERAEYDDLTLLTEAAAEIERLREALKYLVEGIQEYEWINNLSPSPGKPDCWQSVTHARKLLQGTPWEPVD